MELQLGLDPEQLTALRARIDEVDSKLAALSSSAASARTTVIDSLVVGNEAVWKSPADAMVNHAADYSDEQLVAFVYGIRQYLASRFGDRMNELIQARVKELEASAPSSQISDEERKALVKEAKEGREYFKMMKGLLTLQGHDVSHVPDPQNLRGLTSSGKKRRRLEVKYTHSIDGTPCKPSGDSISSIAQRVWPGPEDTEGDRAERLWDYLENPGPDPDGNPQTRFDFKNLPEDHSVYLPNGKRLVMTAIESNQPIVADDDSDDEDVEDDDED